MPNFKLKMKVNQRIQTMDFVARDIEDAKTKAMTKYPVGVILEIEQKGGGGELPRQQYTNVSNAPKSGHRIILILIILLALAGVAYAYFTGLI